MPRSVKHDDRVRPPSPAHRVLAARRRVPHRGAARPGGRAEDAGAWRSPSTATCSRRSSFHDEARKRGIKPILGLRGVRRAGRSHGPIGHAGRDGEPPRAARRDERGLPQPHQARLVRLHRGLLLQAAHRQGAARAARARAHRPQQLPQGRSRDRHPHRAGAQGAARRRRRTATSSARATSSSRCSTRASTSSASSTPACCRSRATSACRSCARTTCTTCGRPTSTRTTCCCASARARASATRSGCKYHGDQFFLKTARRDGGGLRRLSRGAAQHGAHRRALQRRRSRTGRRTCRTSTVPPGFTLDSYFEHVVREGFEERLPRLRALEARGRAAPAARRLRSAAGVRDRHDQADEVPGLLPDRLGLHPLRARAAASRSGPGRGSAAGSLVAYCLRITDVDPLHFDLVLRALPQPRARRRCPISTSTSASAGAARSSAYVTEKYGRENVAQIITFGTMKARAVVRDVGRVMDMPISEVDRSPS